MKINFEKVKNYNQFLLALAGTIAILFMVFLGFFGLYEQYRYSFQDHYNVGVLASEETDGLQKDSLRKQIISFSSMNLVDSAEQFYLLSVTQADLVDYERNEDLLGLLNTTDQKLFRNISGVDNNLVLCDLINGKSDIVFKTRVSIANFIVHQSNGRKYLIIRASSRDTNKDKYLNSEDLQELFVYDIGLKALTKIESKENFTTISVTHLIKSNQLIGQFGLDRNKNGKFERSREPIIYYKVDVEKKTLINMVTEDQIQALQKLLEGGR